MFEYGLIHIIVLIFSYYNYGLVFGTMFLCMFVYLLDFGLNYYGYVRLPFADLWMAFEEGKVNHNIGGYFEVQKISFEEFEKNIYERAILKLRKMSQILVKHYGCYMWKDIDIELAKKQIIRDQTVLKHDQDCINYTNELVNVEMDRSKPLWEFHLIENYSETTSMVVVKMHHSFTDGVGYSSLMSFINDNEFITKGTKPIPKPTLLQNLMLNLYTPIQVYKTMKMYLQMHTDNESERFFELKSAPTYRNSFYASKYINFDDIRKWYKRYPGMTFNDYMLGVISKAFSKINNKAEQIKMTIPVNLRDMPKSIDEVHLGNKVIGIKFLLPISDDIESTMKQVKPVVKEMLHPKNLYAIWNLALLVPLLPEMAGRFLFKDFYNRVRILFSNVPFSNETWHFWNKEVIRFGAFANVQHDVNMNLVAFTYKNEMRFTIAAKSDLKMDVQKYMDNVIDYIEADIRQNSKSD